MALNQPATPQHGAVLATALMFLLILTLLALSSVNSVTLDLARAGNTVYASNAFQLAENAIEHSLDTITVNPGLLTAGGPYNIVQTPVANLGAFEAETVFVDDGPACTHATLGVLTRRHFKIVATGYSARNAFARHVQGFYLCAPAPAAAGPIPDCTPSECPIIAGRFHPRRTFWTVRGPG